MSDFVKPLAEWCAATIEAFGVSLIALIAFYTIFLFVYHAARRTEIETMFRKTRERLGRGILLGLEFLVAADIIHTVAVDLNYKTVGVLAIIVLIRTFLSIALDMELTGKLPWQRKPNG